MHGRGSRAWVLSRPDAGDLAPDVRAVGEVEVLERPDRCVTGRALVRAQQGPCSLRSTDPLEVHREEGRVGQAVAGPEVLVELQAVQDPGPVRQREDVISEEVPVSVEDPALTGPDLPPRSTLGPTPSSAWPQCVGRRSLSTASKGDGIGLGLTLMSPAAECVDCRVEQKAGSGRTVYVLSCPGRSGCPTWPTTPTPMPTALRNERSDGGS